MEQEPRGSGTNPTSTSATGHRWLEHTADLALEVWAPSEEALLVEAMRAVVAVVTEGLAPRPDAQRELRLEALDPEDRLVRWLNEVLYWVTAAGFIPASADVSLPDERTLEARVRGQGEAASLVRTEIKAATYHDLSLERAAGRVVARVVLDV